MFWHIVISFPFLIITPWNHEWWKESLLCLMIYCRYITNILSVHLLQFSHMCLYQDLQCYEMIFSGLLYRHTSHYLLYMSVMPWPFCCILYMPSFSVSTVHVCRCSVWSPDSLFQLHFFRAANLRMFFKTTFIFLALVQFSFSKVCRISKYLRIEIL